MVVASPWRLPGDALGRDAFAALFDAAADYVFVVDEQGVIQAANVAACAGFGYVDHDLRGRSIEALMTEVDAAAHARHVAEQGQTSIAGLIGGSRDVVGRRSDGSNVSMRLSIGALESEGRRLYIGIGHDIGERVAFTERIAYLAEHDDLTGCYNRLGGMTRLNELVAKADAQDGRIAVLVVDVDGFKTVNDHHGHLLGDSLLVAIVDRLRTRLRADDVLARTGGDEFVVVAPISESPSAVTRLAEDLVDTLSRAFEIDGRELRVGASIGVSLYPDDAIDADSLLGHADIAMYQAKRGGGSRVSVFTDELKRQADHTYEIVDGLREALEHDNLVVHYQPQFDLETMRPVGLEALVRWERPAHGLVMPDDFIDIALEWGVLPAIGRWVLRRAAADHAHFVAHGLIDGPVAVNVCAPLLADPGFVPFVTSVLADTGLDPKRLELEIVEQVALTRSPQLVRNLDELAALGITVAMDDFGTGYASMTQLRTRRFGKLKIDRSFVAAVPEREPDVAIVLAILEMGEGLGLTLVAEGIESDQQRKFLFEHGCQIGQGFWFAPPMARDDLIAWFG